MKNKYIILSILLLFASNTIFAQTNYTNGFNTGYKKGYCQDQGVGCIDPIPPIAPIPKIGESSDNYTDGYNRGFKMGLNARKSNNSSSSNTTRYQTAKPKFLENVMYEAPINLLQERLEKADREYEAKRNFILTNSKNLKPRVILLSKKIEDPMILEGFRQLINDLDKYQYNLDNHPEFINYYKKSIIDKIDYFNKRETSISSPKHFSYSENKQDEIYGMKAGTVLREGPGLNYPKKVNKKASEFAKKPIYRSVTYMSKVQIESEKEGWSKVKGTGWLKTEYILKRDEKNTYNINEVESNINNNILYTTTLDNPISKVYLYSKPNINSKIRYECPKNSKVKVVDNSGELFYKVIVDEYSGYITKHHLKRQW
jgi:hypothetical protein